ncbi:MAG: DUF7351 domain-containing protein [Halobacteriota archaeon]
MSSTDTRRDDEGVAPEDAFALVGEENRLAILEGLWRLDGPVRFSELRAEVGVDDSAQFNYHLGKLTGRFVRKTADGYELMTAGERVMQAIFAGSFTEHPRRSIDIDDPCVNCGAPLEAHYEDEKLTIECPACGHGHGSYPFPPGGLHDRTDGEILHAFDQRVRHLHCLAKDGVCPACNGRMTTTVERGGQCCLGTTVRATHACRQCGHELCAAVGLGLLDHSAVVTFHGDRGVALSSTPYWRLPWCVDDEPVDIESTDPWRVTVDIACAGDLLRVTVDDDLHVVDTVRRPDAA